MRCKVEIGNAQREQNNAIQAISNFGNCCFCLAVLKCVHSRRKIQEKHHMPETLLKTILTSSFTMSEVAYSELHSRIMALKYLFFLTI